MSECTRLSRFACAAVHAASLFPWLAVILVSWLVFLLLLVFPIVVALWLCVVSLGALIGQASRREILSLRHVHLMLVPLGVFFLAVSAALWSDTLPAQDLAAAKASAIAFVAIVVCPYACLLGFRAWQVAHPERYVGAKSVFSLQTRDGARHGLLAGAIGVVVVAATFAALLLPPRLLIYAAKTDRLALARPLVALGVNVEARTGTGHTPFWFACRNGNLEMTRLFFTKGIAQASLCPALAIASLHGRNEVVRLLLEHGADVNCSDSSGGTALIAACVEYGQPETVRLLLERGAAVNKTNESGATALYYACQRGDLKTARLLLDAGADPELRPSFGSGPMLEALRHSDAELVELLKAHGAKEP